MVLVGLVLVSFVLFHMVHYFTWCYRFGIICLVLFVWCSCFNICSIGIAFLVLVVLVLLGVGLGWGGMGLFGIA